ncbi:MAG: hypothetical protein HUU01_19800, partial [Saprospiraceae bacterium]|nr:hypothetical protein [Saprospiraceae bacterium]
VPAVRNGDGTCAVEGVPVSISAPSAPVLEEVTITDASNCEASDGTLTLVATGGQGVFQYSITGAAGPWQSSPVFSNLSAGEYVPAVRNGDGTCAVEGVPVSISSPSAPSITGIEVIEVSTCGANDGRIVIEASGGTGSYQFSINGIEGPWQFHPTFTNLTPGSYMPAVRNAGGNCITLGTWILVPGEEVPDIEVLVDQPTACETPNGQIFISLENGASNWNYSINGGATWQNTPIFPNLSVGTYTVSIRNNTGVCMVELMAPVILAAPVTLSFTTILYTNPDSCTHSDGQILLGVSTPGSFEYSIDDGHTWHRDSLFTHLAAGTYFAKARLEGGGCEMAQATMINLNLPYLPDILDVISVDPTSCLLPNGSLQVTLADTTQSYEVSIDGGDHWQMQTLWQQLPPGNYQIRVRVSGGDCEVVYPVNVDLEAPASIGGVADFLLPATGVINEPVVAIDISWPVPQSIRWIYDDPRIVTLQSLPTQEILEFTEPDWYIIGLEIFSGYCSQYLEREIRIYGTRDSLDSGPPVISEQQIRSFEIYPNPNNGAFQAKLVLTEPATGQIWLFRRDGTLVEHRQLEGADFYLETYEWTDLPPGVYTALAQCSEDWIYVNFVIQ